MSKNLVVQAPPHIHSQESTRRLMLLVLISLLPALVAATCLFGLRALLLSACCIVFCVGFEHLACRMWKRPNSIGDLSAAVTGLLLALNLPVTLPIPMAAIGCFFAIVIVKQLFGGIGQNFVNPALAARVMLLVSFAQPMTHWVLPGQPASPDAVTSATPLGMLALEGSGELPSYWQLFIGMHGGSMGETCIAALLIGGVFLLLTKVIRPVIPLTYLGAVAVFCFLLGEDPLYHLMSGGVVLGAFFMATDYSTCPITDKGKFIYALGCAVITVVIRCFGSYPEGVSFSILLMNLCTPLIDRLCVTRPFGSHLEKKKEEVA